MDSSRFYKETVEALQNIRGLRRHPRAVGDAAEAVRAVAANYYLARLGLPYGSYAEAKSLVARGFDRFFTQVDSRRVGRQAAQACMGVLKESFILDALEVV
jgi:hypothetical protein